NDHPPPVEYKISSNHSSGSTDSHSTFEEVESLDLGSSSSGSFGGSLRYSQDAVFEGLNDNRVPTTAFVKYKERSGVLPTVEKLQRLSYTNTVENVRPSRQLSNDSSVNTSLNDSSSIPESSSKSFLSRSDSRISTLSSDWSPFSSRPPSRTQINQLIPKVSKATFEEVESLDFGNDIANFFSMDPAHNIEDVTKWLQNSEKPNFEEDQGTKSPSGIIDKERRQLIQPDTAPDDEIPFAKHTFNKLRHKSIKSHSRRSIDTSYSSESSEQSFLTVSNGKMGSKDIVSPDSKHCSSTSISSLSTESELCKLPFETEYEYHVRLRKLNSSAKQKKGTTSSCNSIAQSVESSNSSFSSGNSPLGQSNMNFDYHKSSNHMHHSATAANYTAEDVLANLGFCNMQNFLPERFLRDWFDKINVERNQKIAQLQQNEIASMLEGIESESSLRVPLPKKTSLLQRKHSSDVQYKMDIRSRRLLSTKRSQFHRSATLASLQSRGQLSTKQLSPKQWDFKRRDSIDELKDVLSAHQINLTQVSTGEKKRRHYAGHRQKSLPLYLESVSEEEESNNGRKKLSFMAEELSVSSADSDAAHSHKKSITNSSTSDSDIDWDGTDGKASDSVFQTPYPLLGTLKNSSLLQSSYQPTPTEELDKQDDTLKNDTKHNSSLSGESMEVADIFNSKKVINDLKEPQHSPIVPAMVSIVLNDTECCPHDSLDKNKHHLLHVDTNLSISPTLSPQPQSPITVIELEELDNTIDRIDQSPSPQQLSTDDTLILPLLTRRKLKSDSSKKIHEKNSKISKSIQEDDGLLSPILTWSALEVQSNMLQLASVFKNDLCIVSDKGTQCDPMVLNSGGSVENTGNGNKTSTGINIGIQTQACGFSAQIIFETNKEHEEYQRRGNKKINTDEKSSKISLKRTKSDSMKEMGIGDGTNRLLRAKSLPHSGQTEIVCDIAKLQYPSDQNNTRQSFSLNNLKEASFDSMAHSVGSSKMNAFRWKQMSSETDDMSEITQSHFSDSSLKPVSKSRRGSLQRQPIVSITDEGDAFEMVQESLAEKMNRIWTSNCSEVKTNEYDGNSLKGNEILVDHVHPFFTSVDLSKISQDEEDGPIRVSCCEVPISIKDTDKSLKCHHSEPDSEIESLKNKPGSTENISCFNTLVITEDLQDSKTVSEQEKVLSNAPKNGEVVVANNLDKFEIDTFCQTISVSSDNDPNKCPTTPIARIPQDDREMFNDTLDCNIDDIVFQNQIKLKGDQSDTLDASILSSNEETEIIEDGANLACIPDFSTKNKKESFSHTINPSDDIFIELVRTYIEGIISSAQNIESDDRRCLASNRKLGRQEHPVEREKTLNTVKNSIFSSEQSISIEGSIDEDPYPVHDVPTFSVENNSQCDKPSLNELSNEEQKQQKADRSKEQSEDMCTKMSQTKRDVDVETLIGELCKKDKKLKFNNKANELAKSLSISALDNALDNGDKVLESVHGHNKRKLILINKGGNTYESLNQNSELNEYTENSSRINDINTLCKVDQTETEYDRTSFREDKPLKCDNVVNDIAKDLLTDNVEKLGNAMKRIESIQEKKRKFNCVANDLAKGLLNCDTAIKITNDETETKELNEMNTSMKNADVSAYKISQKVSLMNKVKLKDIKAEHSYVNDELDIIRNGVYEKKIELTDPDINVYDIGRKGFIDKVKYTKAEYSNVKDDMMLSEPSLNFEDQTGPRNAGRQPRLSSHQDIHPETADDKEKIDEELNKKVTPEVFADCIKELKTSPKLKRRLRLSKADDFKTRKLPERSNSLSHSLSSSSTDDSDSQILSCARALMYPKRRIKTLPHQYQSLEVNSGDSYSFERSLQDTQRMKRSQTEHYTPNECEHIIITAPEDDGENEKYPLFTKPVDTLHLTMPDSWCLDHDTSDSALSSLSPMSNWTPTVFLSPMKDPHISSPFVSDNSKSVFVHSEDLSPFVPLKQHQATVPESLESKDWCLGDRADISNISVKMNQSNKYKSNTNDYETNTSCNRTNTNASKRNKYDDETNKSDDKANSCSQTVTSHYRTNINYFETQKNDYRTNTNDSENYTNYHETNTYDYKTSLNGNKPNTDIKSFDISVEKSFMCNKQSTNIELLISPDLFEENSRLRSQSPLLDLSKRYINTVKSHMARLENNHFNSQGYFNNSNKTQIHCGEYFKILHKKPEANRFISVAYVCPRPITCGIHLEN
ncbi:unnamed protein product, partial [Owenia fusiformis]